MVMAVEMRWSLYAAVVLFSVQVAHSHRSLQGLSCINDFIRNLSCTWSGSPFDPGVHCLISGVRGTFPGLVTQSCNVTQGTSPPGCSISFEKMEFTFYESMPSISMTCNGMLVANITRYCPQKHVKMHPPGVPNVTCSGNETWISWNPSSPRSDFIKVFDFQVQMKQHHQTWKEAQVFPTQHHELQMYTRQLQGPHQVRVRVKPADASYQSDWSDWSQTTSWMGADMTPATQYSGWIQGQTSLVTLLVFIISGFITVVSLVIYRYCIKSIVQKGKEVPNPSKYFGTLHSVQEGNLKEWLNPLAAPESFFRAEPCDHISLVEVCETWDVVPSTSPSFSSTTALLHFRGYPSAESDTSGVADNSSSSSSSCFSNMGYFMSSYTGSSAPTNPSPAYFTYNEDFLSPHNSHSLHLSLCPSISTSSKYESLKMEPQSPDSGFGIDKEGNDTDMEVENEEVSEEDQRSPLFILPLVSLSPPSPPPQPASLTQVFSVSHQVEAPVGAGTAGTAGTAAAGTAGTAGTFGTAGTAAAGTAGTAAAGTAGDSAAWPVTMCRSSSMPVEPCRTGYLTLKELQTTFSNKSI
ncbi:interleukin-2 receptor subunit beta [Sphaeramia orbicularis]|uniref:Interleukin-2 receptor subunit beta-like n=1 Tax=Sphaeramia orbicularis TaxID=375764 RepID=A0A672YAB7_9TELE|nr:interleukin-2 receptor subunit beta-like [Sphaeramia orbicularis]XP_029996191.1 interleukin-2 receptor subunit beta-like [Sphaeramia orbicularis]